MRPEVSELPPSVATAWTAAVREAGAFLWPLIVQKTDASAIFDLLKDSDLSESSFTIRYDPVSGSSTRDDYRYPAQQPQISETELEALAEKAS